MRNFQDTFETRKCSFISAFSICMTVPLRTNNHRKDVKNLNAIEACQHLNNENLQEIRKIRTK